MTLKITIDKNNNAATLVISSDSEQPVEWNNLDKDNQINILNALYGFISLLQKDYLKINKSEDDDSFDL